MYKNLNSAPSKAGGPARRLPESKAPGGAMTIAETADYLRISVSSVWRLFRDGEPPKTIVAGRSLVRRVDADELLARCVGKSA